MGRTLSILGIVSAVLAAFTAIMLVDIAAAVIGVFVIGAGIYLAISRDPRRMGPGIAAILLGILGILGILGSVGGQDASVEFPISVAVGHALVVAGALCIAGASALLTWGGLEPEWISYVWVAFWALGVLLALVYRAHLGDQTLAGSYVVAVLSLANLGAPIMRLLHKE